MAYHQPTSLDDALSILDSTGAEMIAGGTDWYPSRGERPLPGQLLDLTRIETLRGINRREGGWWIGACTTWSEIVETPMPPAFDGLKAAAREVGSIQIQNSGTVAGNLCNASPAADGVPPLLTLEAQVLVASRAGERALALSEFLTGVRQTALQPGEILTGLWLPPPPDHMRSAFLKLGARRYLVISIAMVSVLLLVEAGKILEARIAVGACSPVALRLPEMEAALSGTRPADCEERLTEAHLAPLSPISDVRADQAYRADAVLTLCIRAIAKAA